MNILTQLRLLRRHVEELEANQREPVKGVTSSGACPTFGLASEAFGPLYGAVEDLYEKLIDAQHKALEAAERYSEDC